jgi:putative Mn2+ efflux pump MntP
MVMEVFTIIVIAVGLAMDAFAVSVAAGAAERKLHIRHAMRMAIFFGAFQAVMPLIGWLAGEGFKDSIAAYDHWIAFWLLALVGGKMIFESFKLKGDKDNAVDPTSVLVVLTLAVATSIDALAVGITLSLVTDSILFAVVMIGIITFVLSLAGIRIGMKVGHFFENKIEIFGGVILLLIGIKILAEHLIAGK